VVVYMERVLALLARSLIELRVLAQLFDTRFNRAISLQDCRPFLESWHSDFL
jgi:hypothetical protein